MELDYKKELFNILSILDQTGVVDWDDIHSVEQPRKLQNWYLDEVKFNKRNELLKKLNLTQEEKELLGIK